MISIKHYIEASERVSYDPCTGIFTWKKHRYEWRNGVAAGGVDAQGYYRFSITINSEVFVIKGHRLAWFITHGELPKQVDHINHDKSDNRIENLRGCNNNQNQWNKKPFKGKVSRFKGVTFRRNRGKWRSRITFNGRVLSLGDFNEEEEAAKAYNDAAVKYFGEFSNLNKFPIDNNLSEV